MNEKVFVNRPRYIQFLERHKNKHIIKVMSGVRRAGKSVIFELFREQLRAEGVDPSHIIDINFENLAYYELRDMLKLNAYIESQMTDDSMYYIFLDEIQHVRNFELVVDSLFIKPNVDLYITGSNAYFMSGDLATNLTGRYVEMEVLPLSFAEYVLGQDATQDVSVLFNAYLLSGFPYLLHTQDDAERIEYLQGIYNTVLLNDVVSRAGDAQPELLERIIRTLLSSIGSVVSVPKIRNTLESQGEKVSRNALDKYVDALTDSLLFYATPRYDVKGRNLLQRLEKYYTVDLGMRRLLLPDHQEDFGHMLENLVYLELRRRFAHVYVGNVGKYEVDFVGITATGECEYYQVSETTLAKETLARELRPLQAIQDQYPKYLLTMDTVMRTANYEGIRKLNVMDWLLGEN